MAQHIIDRGEKSPQVYCSSKWKSFYQSFCTNRNNTDENNIPIFDKYTNIYTLCCTIGYKEGKRSALEKKDSLFTLEQIDQDEEWPLLLSIAWLGSDRDISIFRDTRKMLDICSEYAETGLNKLAQEYPFDEIFKNGELIISKKTNELEYDILNMIRGLKNDYIDAEL